MAVITAGCKQGAAVKAELSAIEELRFTGGVAQWHCTGSRFCWLYSECPTARLLASLELDGKGLIWSSGCLESPCHHYQLKHCPRTPKALFLAGC